jgi:glycosyltransferase involved in cell wall biosynthesis
MRSSERTIPYLTNIRTPYKQKQLGVWGNFIAPREVHVYYAESRHTLGWTPESPPGIREYILCFNLAMLWRLLKEATQSKIVLLGGYFFWQAWVVWLAHFICGFKCVLVVDGVAPSALKQLRMSSVKEQLKKFFLQHCHSFLANGKISRQLLLQYGISSNRIYNQYLTVDLDLLHSVRENNPEACEALKARWKLHPGKKVVRYCGRLVRRKRVAALIQAAAKVNRTMPIQLLITGSGDELTNLQKMAKELAVPVVFTGAITNQSDLFRLYSISDLAVLPSENEPWGLVVMEAVAMNVPAVVSSDCGCAEDLVFPGQNGFVYPAGDIDRLAECIHDALTELAPETVRQQGRKIEKDWNYERSAEQLCLCLDVT